jgi:phosphoglucosamine mutase
MIKYFGTDGMRGVAGQFPMDYSTVCILGEALVELLRKEGLPPRVIIGRDTRESGRWMEQALFQGIESKNGEAVSSGIIPTSAVSFLAKTEDFSAGIIISASHNPYHDNGIKIFSSTGMKIPETWENRLEDSLQRLQRSVEPVDMPIISEKT